MNNRRCIYHPVTQGIAFCKRCNGYICTDCIITVNDKKWCKKCYNDYNVKHPIQKKCINHPNKEVIGYCKKCAGYLCQECMVVQGDKKYCKKCYNDYQAVVNRSKAISSQPVCVNHTLNKGIIYCEECNGYLCKDCIVINLNGDFECRKHNKKYQSTRSFENPNIRLTSIAEHRYQESVAGVAPVPAYNQPQQNENMFASTFSGNTSVCDSKAFSPGDTSGKSIKKLSSPKVLFAVFIGLLILIVLIYIIGRPNGVRICKCENLKIRNELVYIINGEKPYSGMAVHYYDGGQKRQEVNFRNGELHGKVTEWYDNGIKSVEAMFQFGRQTGMAIEWYDNGQIARKTIMTANDKTRILERWSKNGRILTQENHDDDDVLPPKFFYFMIGNKFYDAKHLKIANVLRVNLGTSPVTDFDGNVYKTVKIGNQLWMAENLKVTHYRNGNTIPNVTSHRQWDRISTGAFCSYNNDDANIATYGRLYNWFAIKDTRGLAPSGWHIPSDAEWQILVDYLGGNDIAGGKMKTGTSHWQGPINFADNESGLSALPGGRRIPEHYMGKGNFGQLGRWAQFWTSTQSNQYENGAISWFLYNHAMHAIQWDGFSKTFGFSVRCIKD